MINSSTTGRSLLAQIPLLPSRRPSSTTCQDRFLATTTLFKVAAMLFRRYNVGLDEPGQEWELRKHWMVYNDKTRVRIAGRSVPV